MKTRKTLLLKAIYMELKTKKALIGGGILLFGITGFIASLNLKADQGLKINSKASQIDTVPKKLSLFFVGDMMGHKPMIDAAFVGDKYIYDPWFQYIKSHVEKYDLAIANLEVTLAGSPYSGYPLFCSPDSYAKSIQDTGFDFLITANNHSQDKGRKGLERTIDMLDSLKFKHTGTFKNKSERDKIYPYYWETKGVKIAFLNYSYGTNGIPVTPPNIVNLIDTNQIKIDIKKAQNDGSQFIITTLHWGDEYQRKQNQWQDKLAQWLADKGVDAIIGMHPHVVQPMKIIHPKNNLKKSVPVAFSLGNFISNQRDRYKNGGIGVELNLQVLNGKVTWETWGYYPFWVQLGGKPRGYYIIPVSDWEKNTNKYNLTAEESTLIKQFAVDTRDLLKEVKELFFD
jgi:poly-gamma-glutamate synthesis protein (capsule biosynthesis protein)